jgi:O-antigen/teichoic acid export membrane protein
MLATLASMIAALALPAVATRRWFARPLDDNRRIQRGEAVRSLLPVMIGLLSITALTSADVVVAKLALTATAAGIYGSASLVGRVILYFPSAIITVLLPRVTTRVVDRRDTSDLLARSAGVTAAFCAIGTLVYAIAGSPITRVAFGAKYAEAGGLLWLFGIAMSGFAILNVLLIYNLGRAQNRTSWLLLGGAGAQTLIFLLVHGSPRQLVVVDIAVAYTLIVLHELLVDAALTRSVRAALLSRGARRL